MPSQAFKNRVAVITGSSRGIGKALAYELASRGAKVVLNGRDPACLSRTHDELETAGIDCTAVRGDVTSVADCVRLIRGAFDRYGRIDVLVNNAGMSSAGSVSAQTLETVRKVVDVNVHGAFAATKSALPYIVERKGSIVFVSSLAGLHGLPWYSAYCASKMALTAIAESLRTELHGTGVHVGIIYLGITENDPKKTCYGPDGALRPVPRRRQVRIMPVTVVAKQIASDIERRKSRSTYSSLGTLLAFTNRLFPGVVDWAMVKVRKRIIADLSG
jgi:NAD(P)-dependent dehydrogenase (short-subunit alcohol dehydrogenase family)